jgi:hypothetical protein
MLGKSLSNLKPIDYENRSPWFPGSVVFGIGAGEKSVAERTRATV